MFIFLCLEKSENLSVGKIPSLQINVSAKFQPSKKTCRLLSIPAKEMLDKLLYNSIALVIYDRFGATSPSSMSVHVYAVLKAYLNGTMLGLMIKQMFYDFSIIFHSLFPKLWNILMESGN